MSKSRIWGGGSYRKRVKVIEEEEDEEEEKVEEVVVISKEHRLFDEYTEKKKLNWESVNEIDRLALVLGHPTSSRADFDKAMQDLPISTFSCKIVADAFAILGCRYRSCNYDDKKIHKPRWFYPGEICVSSTNAMFNYIADWYDDDPNKFDYDEKWVDECVYRLEKLCVNVFSMNRKFIRKFHDQSLPFWDNLGYSPELAGCKTLSQIIPPLPSYHVVMKYAQCELGNLGKFE